MKALIVHNSDEVKDVFIGQDNNQILGKLKESVYWPDIVERVLEDEEVSEDVISIYMVTELYHDGDSEDGYTLLETI